MIYVSFSLTGSDSYPERRGMRKGNTVYVYGSGLVEDNLRPAFSQHGNIIDLSMDNPRKYGTIKTRLSEHLCRMFRLIVFHFDTVLILCFLFCLFSCAFITFEKMESADQAVAEVCTGSTQGFTLFFYLLYK